LEDGRRHLGVGDACQNKGADNQRGKQDFHGVILVWPQSRSSHFNEQKEGKHTLSGEVQP
jgi:hypothetical protein